jgi:DNA-binding response OmpR family regulator
MECVLIVDSDVLVRHPLAEYLRECGYRVLEAADSEEARALMNAEQVTVDVLMARGPAAFALASWVRTAHPGIKIILAGSIETEATKAGDLCEDGSAEALPYEHKFVLERIRQLLAGRGRAGGE